MSTNTITEVPLSLGQLNLDLQILPLESHPLLDAPDQVDQAAKTRALSEAQTKPHWLLVDSDYSEIIRDLVACVRSTQRLSQVKDIRSDAALGADLLVEMGLWESTQPQGGWGKFRFCVKFIAAYAHVYLHLKLREGCLIRANQQV